MVVLDQRSAGGAVPHPLHPSLSPSIAAAKLTGAALHTEGLVNTGTYRIWVGPSAFKGKMASVLSLSSFL